MKGFEDRATGWLVRRRADGLIDQWERTRARTGPGWTVNTCPTDTRRGEEACTASAPGVETVTCVEERTPVASPAPEFASVPVTVVERSKVPGTDPVMVQVKTRHIPPAKLTGREGAGPRTGAAPPVPACRGVGAATPLAVAVPVLVTVSITRKSRPVHTAAGNATSDAASMAGASTMTVADTAGVVSGASEFASVPVTVVVTTTRPGVVPVKVHVKVSELSPGMATGRAGFGPASCVTSPGQLLKNAAALTPVARACPELVTVSVNRKGWLTLTFAGRAFKAAESSAAVWMVADTPGADAMTAVPPHVVPRAVAGLQGDPTLAEFAREAREFLGERDFELLPIPHAHVGAALSLGCGHVDPDEELVGAAHAPPRTIEERRDIHRALT